MKVTPFPAAYGGAQGHGVDLYFTPEEAADHEILPLLHVERLAQLSIEPTSSCNLACVYCHFAPLDRRGNDFSEVMIDRIITFVETFPVEVVTLAGAAEFTLYDGWEAIARRLLDAGTNLRCISNFTKGIFDEEAVDMLSRFQEILVSLDTANPTLLKKTRYRADLRTMTLNLQQVRAKALFDGRPPPKLICNAVVYDLNFLELDKLAAFAIVNGFDELSLQPCLSGLHPHPLGLEWAQTGYRGARHGCSRPRRSPIPAFATRVPATFPR